MKRIETETEFKEVLLLKKAMVFIFFEWSGQAHFSKKIVVEWENKSKFAIPLFELEPDELPDVLKWVQDEVKERSGYGSLVWLKDGRILDSEMNVGKFGTLELERKTSEIFQC